MARSANSRLFTLQFSSKEYALEGKRRFALVIRYCLLVNRKSEMKNKGTLLKRIFFVLSLVSVAAVPITEIQARTRPTPTPSSSGHPTGRLIVQRAPNFGTDLSIRLSIDGKKVADIPRNQHYGGVLGAGRHVVTALALPNTRSRRPTSISVAIKSRQVYIFTATWEGDRLVLQPSNFYMPTVRANAR